MPELAQVIKALSEHRAPPADILYRAGSVSRYKTRAQALAYLEPRAYERVLDAVCGPEWSVRFVSWGEQRLICELTILGVTRASTGEFDANDKIAQGTTAEAQAFKRACSKFGLFRYLYDLPIAWVPYDESKRQLAETPVLPTRFHPPKQSGSRPQVVSKVIPEVGPQVSSEAEPEMFSSSRASAMHRELGKLRTITSREHNTLASEALGREINSFTQLTEPEARRVWNHARQVDMTRQQEGQGNPERPAPRGTITA